MKNFVLTWRNAINGRSAVANGTIDSAAQSEANRQVERRSATSAGRRMQAAYFANQGA